MGGQGNKIIKNMNQQDVFLYGNPDITFFKAVFKRHTRFYSEYIHHPFDSSSAPDFGKTVSCEIRQAGDLIGETYLEAIIKGNSTNANSYTVNHFGNSLLKKVTLKIGSQTIDTTPGLWLQIWKELHQPNHNRPESGSNVTYGGRKHLFNMDFTNAKFTTDNVTPLDEWTIDDRIEGDYPMSFGGLTDDGGANSFREMLTDNYGEFANSIDYYKKIRIPLRFFFNNHKGLALPMCALTENEVRITIDLETKARLIGSVTTLTLDSLKLFTETYYLSNDERGRFVNGTHKYLIEQVQHLDKSGTTGFPIYSSGTQTEVKNIELNSFNHPVKYLAWAVQEDPTSGTAGVGPNYLRSMVHNSLWGNDGSYINNSTGTFKIKLNDEDISQETIQLDYYTRTLMKRYCKGHIPDLDRIGIYSFSLNPFEWEPSGTCNFSTFYRKQIDISLSNNTLAGFTATRHIHIFAVNYNILQIASGQGGLLYI